ncbi:MAG: CDP-alcohol phosphatidyltransferase family protein [Nanoarchaeota archaeon]|nr:CDP-alcohol phosphatidyltransferase family protein [Nanoarchaeota archaeon]MBU1134995.1 CDP-alcohol phosphatidyltransferase family protein [Nanoarchaeota archaeon]MBU2520076.1 CDP-alcohol phosphatidyltransferase family protein [Nanoarchaeota archaeon]
MAFYKNRQKFGGFSIKIGIIFSKFRLSPNTWTIISLIPALVAVWFLMQESFLIAALLFIFSAFIDLIDGSVARVTGRVSVFGAYLDTVVDRYVEAIIIFGLLFASLPAFAIPMTNIIVPVSALIFLYFFGGLMTTYVKAAAKEKGLVEKELKGGLLERAERLMLLFVGILLAIYDPMLLTYMLVLLAVLTNITAFQRIRIAAKNRRH